MANELMAIHNHQPSSINHQPSTINHQPSTINHQPSTINHQPSTMPSLIQVSRDGELFLTVKRMTMRCFASATLSSCNMHPHVCCSVVVVCRSLASNQTLLYSHISNISTSWLA
jgi:hypothetical protein